MVGIRFIPCGLFLFAALSCGSRTPPPPVAQPEIAVLVSVPTTETYNIGGESDPLYTLVIQRVEFGNTGIEQDYQAKGEVVVRDWNRITWGKGNIVVIDGGKLTINGVDRGQLTRGSRVEVSPSGEVAVALATVGPLDDILRQHIYPGSKKMNGDSMEC